MENNLSEWRDFDLPNITEEEAVSRVVPQLAQLLDKNGSSVYVSDILHTKVMLKDGDIQYSSSIITPHLIILLPI